MIFNNSYHNPVFKQPRSIGKSNLELHNNSQISHSSTNKYIDFVSWLNNSVEPMAFTNDSNQTDELLMSGINHFPPKAIDLIDWLNNSFEPIAFINHSNQTDELLRSAFNKYLETEGLFQKNQSSFKIDEELWIKRFYLIIDGFAISIVASIGIIINMIGTFRLLSTRSERTKMYNLLLSSILIFDTFFLGFQILRTVQTYFISISANYLRPYYVLISSGVRFTFLSSILMLVALAHSRYHAITTPFRQRILLLSWKKRRNLFLTYLIPTIILSMIFTLPISWEIETGLHLIPSKLRLNPYYSIFFVGVLNLGLTGLLPVVYLIYITYNIVTQMKKQNRIIRKNQASVSKIRSDQCNQDDKVSKNFVSMIILYVLLHSLRIITCIGEVLVVVMPNKDDSNLQLGYGIPKWLQIVAPISDLCTVLNASINIIIYKYLTTLFTYCPVCNSNSFQNSCPSEATSTRRNSQPPNNLQNMEMVNM